MTVATLPASSSPKPVDPVASASRRFVLALALLPIVPAVSTIGMLAITDFAPALLNADADARHHWTTFDELRWFHLIYATLWVAGTIAIWRKLVVWTLGRKWLTSLIAFIPFIQVVYAKPLWTIENCQFMWFGSETQRIAQFQLSAGLYVWILVWCWWGLENWIMKSKPAKIPAIIAGPIARRAAASLGVIPFVIGTFFIVAQWLQDFPKITEPTLALGIAGVVAIAAWILIWRRVVVWKPEAIQITILLSIFCIGAPLALLWLMGKWMVSSFGEALWFCLPIIGWGVFMAGTIALWPLREGLMHSDGPRCLKCAYSLRGLKATRCPECGDEPTLDQLWGAIESH